MKTIFLDFIPSLSLKKNWWQILFLTILTILIIRQGHMIDGTQLPIKLLPLSPFSKTHGASGVMAFITIWFIVVLSGMSVAFLIAEKWMNGSKITKGLKFAISWGMIYFFGAIEWYPVYGKTSLLADIRLGLIDVLGIIALGVLAGKFFASDNRSGKANIKNNSLTLSVMTASYVIGRYFAYTILKIESGYIERPVETFIWTLAAGISFGTFYIVAGRNTSEKSPIKKSAFFGLAIVGPGWMIFNLFFPSVFQGSFVDAIFGRAIVDTIFVVAGAYFSERLIIRNVYDK
jgi:hypothetical protein